VTPFDDRDDDLVLRARAIFDRLRQADVEADAPTDSEPEPTEDF
jgi:hypothetical protein